MLNRQIIEVLEKFAPPILQESWDNTGLQIGNLDDACTGVLVCFDVTPATIAEAIRQNCNLIISHHPLFFKGIKRLTGKTSVEKTAINAITAGISIYSSHTAMDSTIGGVSYTLASLIGVKPERVLDPLADRLMMLKVVVPDTHAERVRDALFDAGAGAIGDYDHCSFNVKGFGTFQALQGANPFVGTIGNIHTEAETEITVVLAREMRKKVEIALLSVHPYETPAYQFIPILNELSNVGLGVYGSLDRPLSIQDFITHVKKALNVKMLRTTPLPTDTDFSVEKVAMCGGAGQEYVGTAIALGAQVYITADVRYHEFVDYKDKIIIIDAGHYETECAIKHVICNVLQKAFPTFNRILCTNLSDNPIEYV